MVLYNLSAERAVLGSIMAEKKAILSVIGLLEPMDFYYPANRYIFSAILELFSEAENIDLLTVSSRLKRLMKEPVEEDYLRQICDEVLTATHIVSYANSVKECAVLRRLKSAGEKITALTETPGSTGEELIDAAEKILVSIRSSKRDERKYSLPSDSKKYEQFVLEKAAQAKKGIPLGVLTGFKSIDNNALLEPGNLVILAARPGIGKSAMAINIAFNAAMYGAKVRYSSLEMTPEELIHRIYARLSGISSTRFKYGSVEKATLLLCEQRLAEMSGSLEIAHEPGASAYQILANSRLFPETNLLIIDHMDLMQEPMERGENRTQALGKATAAMKAYAGKNNCVVLALSQLSREARNDPPELFHLRDSGTKEQDADMVWMLHRDPDPDASDPNAYFSIKKNRNGSPGDVVFRFDAATCVFSEPTGEKVVEWDSI